MGIIKKEWRALFCFALFPCIVWGVCLFSCDILVAAHRKYVDYPTWLSGYPLYRVKYLIRAILLLFTLGHIYKKRLPVLYDTHKKIYLRYSILAIISIVCGFFVKTKFWNYILDGCFVSPFIEELIARFILYEARHHGWKLYALVAFFSSLTFSLMHISPDPSVLTQPILLPKLSEHFLFGLALCSIFWFFPRLGFLISIHAISNLYGVLKIASELGAPW
ncbi:CPBP family intramembrane glutamic endopeptidase [Cardinium endosymbiont of Philonthus spinipes]|uniref:CPBP family intramembrane glutamic endopeptidase n=1 Tax=Cardinium endosymbiont of Philonthus spinipes TaxID=3077941 RepID=UPI00313CDBAB